MAQIDLPAFREREAQGLITCRTHPTEDLLIWNYTPQCQFARAWDEVTMQSRGLITTTDGTIVARAFSKFFNIEEHTSLPLEPFKVTEKMDGSLLIVTTYQDKLVTATRGSFTSEQAEMARTIIQKRYSTFDFLPYYTYLFEVIFKSNRIVVDYGDMEDIVLLAVIGTETGTEHDIHDPAWITSWPFPVTQHYDGITDIARLKELEEANKEGFVIHFESGLRVKAKFSEYVRLHRILTQCTARTIWEYLKESKPLADLLEHVPDEFYAWVKSISKGLSGQYQSIHQRTQAVYKEITAQTVIPTPISIGSTLNVNEVDIISRAMKKCIQEQFAQHPDIEPFLLMLYNGGKNKKEQLRLAIWETLYPAADRPFKIDEEEV